MCLMAGRSVPGHGTTLREADAETTLPSNRLVAPAELPCYSLLYLPRPITGLYDLFSHFCFIHWYVAELYNDFAQSSYQPTLPRAYNACNAGEAHPDTLLGTWQRFAAK